MPGLRNFIRHTFHPLHVYCRLRDMRLSGGVARLMCSAYERTLWKILG